eukprot:m.188974 g.188974  ORF g.188974 m.188974 type:complete len:398 (+) comp24840_c0_seq1:308-1501(+)
MGKRKKSRKDLVDEVLCGATAEEVTKWCKDGRANVDAREPDTGRTALMAAAAQAKDKLVVALLALNANTSAVDEWGNTAYHHITHKLTRLPRRIKALLALLGAPNARAMLSAPNRKGTRPLVALYGVARLARNAAASSKEHRRAEEAEAILGAFDPKGDSSGGGGGSLPTASDAAAASWSAKLDEAMLDDSVEDGGRYTSGYHDVEATDPWSTEQDDDDFHDAEPLRSTRRKTDPVTCPPPSDSAPAGPAEPEAPWLRERARLQEEMRAREKQQREASARIIAEEKEKTAALRHRKQAASYQTQAIAFFSGTAGTNVLHVDIPWPGKTVAEVKAVVLAGETNCVAARKLLKQELMRWHPDRWSGATIERVAADDRDSVLETVQATSQLLNSLLGELA